MSKSSTHFNTNCSPTIGYVGWLAVSAGLNMSSCRELSSATTANVKFVQGRAMSRSSRLRVDQETLIARALPTCGSEVGNIESRYKAPAQSKIATQDMGC